MARRASFFTRAGGVIVLFLVVATTGRGSLAYAHKPPVPADPTCVAAITPAEKKKLAEHREEAKKINAKFLKWQSHTTYTPARAHQLQAILEKYVGSIGIRLKNFNVEEFIDQELRKLPEMKRLSRGHHEKLLEVLKPSFESRRLPSLQNLKKDLREAGLDGVPAGKVRAIMDTSFTKWRTKLVLDELGASAYNQFTENAVHDYGIAEVSMDIGLLMKNEWEAFFESEKGLGQFNMSVPGLLSDQITTTEEHEIVHLMVQTLAAMRKGDKESPYQTWIKLEPRYKKTGAIGNLQKKALQSATDPLGDGDYYRTELYADELPAHIVQAKLLSAQIQKELTRHYGEYLDSMKLTDDLREELHDLFADVSRYPNSEIKWDEHSPKARKILEDFLASTGSDGRTKIAKLADDLTEFMNWIDLLNDSVRTGVYEARKILDPIIEASKAAGRKRVTLDPDGPVALLPDTFLGQPGYLIEVKIPIDKIDSKGNFTRVDRGASVKFRFTNQGSATKTITPDKLKKLLDQSDWTSELCRQFDGALVGYDRLLKDGKLEDLNLLDLMKLNFVTRKLTNISERTLERIRDQSH